MCGIYGIIGETETCIDVCLDGLKNLEYRGYDSAGIAGFLEQNLVFCKEVGRLENLKEKMSRQTMGLSTAIGHTRWATHGKVSITNAHPHFDNSNAIAIVHNGIIENYISLKKRLLSLGFIFYSETDSEVIANLIAHYYNGDFLSAIQLSLRDLEGSFAIAAIHKDFTDGIIAASRASPLVIGTTTHGTSYLSSDLHAFIDKTSDVLFLQDNQIIVARKNSISLYNMEGKQLTPTFHTLRSKAPLLSKGSYPHYMLKEIFDQPEAITTIIKSHCKGNSIQFHELPFTSKEMRQFQRIIFLGCGSSWHAGCLVAPFFEKLTGVPVQSEISSEFRYREVSVSPTTLIIAISQSGETADTIAAVRSVKKQGAFIVGVCNVAYSTLTREVHTNLLLEAGPEISVCSTKAFTSQVALLFLLALYCKRENSDSDNFTEEFIEEFSRVPKIILELLQQSNRIQTISRKYSQFEKYFFLGRQYMFPVALEAALKFKEITYVNGVAYPAGEMKHGPLALIDKNTTVIGLCGNNHTYDKIISNIMEVSARKAHVLLIAPTGKKFYPIVDDQFLFPRYLFDELAIFPYIIVMQLFAYYVAVERGCDIDKPRHLAKSVTVE
ncbi:MAG: glutamine--fructose-6-phosphate transaminase (isomerizing) [Chlamydiales bacterium]